MHEDDLILRGALRDLAPTVGENGVWDSLQSRVAAKRRAHRHRLVLAGAALVVIACLGFGAYAITQWWPQRASLLVITDDTTGGSPSSTGQTAQSADEQPSAAMFRGNAARTGVYPSGGPTDRPDLLWKVKIGEPGGTSPVVSDGIVYVGGVGDGDDAYQYLYAFDARSGEEKWRIPWSISWPLTFCPTVSQGVVYIGSDAGLLYALDAVDGQEIWRFHTGGRIGFSPAVSDGMVYFGTEDGYLYALDARTGQQKWEALTMDHGEGLGSVNSSPAVSEGVVYFSDANGYIYALDAQTGQARWSFGPEYWSEGCPFSSPAVSDGVVYFANRGIGPYKGYLHALDAQTGEERWTYEVDGPIRSSPAVSGGVVYLLYDVRENEAWPNGSSALSAVDATTGRELWQFAAANNQPWWPVEVLSSPSISGNVVYFSTASRDGCLYALDASTGEELWPWVTGQYSWVPDIAPTSPAISDGVVYFSGVDGYLYALGNDQPMVDTADDPPELLWKVKTGEGEGSSPVVSDGVVYVAGSNWYVYALDAQSGEERWRFLIEYGMSSSPAVSDGLVYIGSRDGHLHALDAESGQELWRFQTGARCASSPAVSDGVVYLSTLDDDGYLCALDAYSGQQKWSFQTGVDGITGSPAVADGVVYFGTEGRSEDGCLYALDAASGQSIWKYQAVHDGDGSCDVSSLALSQGVVCFVSAGYLYVLDAQTGELQKRTYKAEDGAIACSPAISGGPALFLIEGEGVDDPQWNEPDWTATAVAVDIITGTELWRSKVDRPMWWGFGTGPLSISGETAHFVVAGEDGRIHALDIGTGEELWTWVFGQDPGLDTSSPAISDGVVFFSGTDGYLYALK